MKTDNTIQLVLVNDFSGRNHDGSRESRLINKLANSLCVEILSFREKKYGERFKRGVNYEELHYGIKLFGDRLNHKGSSVLYHNPYIFEAILGHVFVSYYDENLGTGWVVSTLFLVKWSGYSYDRLTWEPLFSLALDIYISVLDYLINFNPVFGPKNIWNTDSSLGFIDSVLFFKNAAGSRPRSVVRSKIKPLNKVKSPIVKEIFKSLEENGDYSDKNGFSR